MKRIRLSFLGLGVVGSQLMEYVRGNLEKTGFGGAEILIDKVYVRDLSKKRGIDTSGLRLTCDPCEAIREADIVVECMGGGGAALTRELVLTAVRDRKPVIMSSKKCLALYGRELVQAVQESGTRLCYDATVGGGIPVSTVLASMGKCETTTRIYGICNATSNFILGQMQGGGSYGSALRRAQELGYAENDPSEDVDGLDALYKAVILMGFGMGHWAACGSIVPASIRTLTDSNFREAEKTARIIKPVFSIERRGKDFSCFVGPRPVPMDSILAPVKDNNNIIVIHGSESGDRAFYGQGAGAKPTASAMFDDLIRTLRDIRAS
jgi:homoserine dehydrogenase